jgi:hypothetical protein
MDGFTVIVAQDEGLVNGNAHKHENEQDDEVGAQCPAIPFLGLWNLGRLSGTLHFALVYQLQFFLVAKLPLLTVCAESLELLLSIGVLVTLDSSLEILDGSNKSLALYGHTLHDLVNLWYLALNWIAEPLLNIEALASWPFKFWRKLLTEGHKVVVGV